VVVSHTSASRCVRARDPPVTSLASAKLAPIHEVSNHLALQLLFAFIAGLFPKKRALPQPSMQACISTTCWAERERTTRAHTHIHRCAHTHIASSHADLPVVQPVAEPDVPQIAVPPAKQPSQRVRISCDAPADWSAQLLGQRRALRLAEKAACRLPPACETGGRWQARRLAASTASRIGRCGTEH